MQAHPQPSRTGSLEWELKNSSSDPAASISNFETASPAIDRANIGILNFKHLPPFRRALVFKFHV